MASKGQNSKFTAEAREAIISRRRIGMPVLFCAQGAEVSDKTVYNWINLGKEHIEGGIDSDFADFFRAYKRAESEGIAVHLGKIHRSDTWQSAAWLLSRCWPEHLAKW